MATSLYSLNDTGGVLTKNDIIVGAYSQLRISGITRQPTPEDLETALSRLEDMAAQFDVTMPIGYNFEDEPDPNSVSGLTRALAQAFKTNLAMRLIPDFNKEVPAVLIAQANQSLSNMASVSALQRLQQVQYPNRQAIGSGNYRWNRWAKFYRVGAQLPANSANKTMFLGDIQDFVTHFDSFLRNGETIESYSIVTDAGLILMDNSKTDTEVLYRIKAQNVRTSSIAQVTVIIATTAGRIDTKRMFIGITPRDQESTAPFVHDGSQDYDGDQAYNGIIE